MAEEFKSHIVYNCRDDIVRKIMAFSARNIKTAMMTRYVGIVLTYVHFNFDFVFACLFVA